MTLFEGSVTRRAIGVVEVVRLASHATQIAEGETLAGKGNGDYFLLGIQRSGSSTLWQDGRPIRLAPGDVAVCANARHLRLDLEGGVQQTMLMMPAALMRAACPGAEALPTTAIKAAQPLVALLGLMADSHFDTPYNDLPAQAATHAANALIGTAAGCLLAFLGQAGSKRSNLSQYHLDRIRRYALEHLGDTELSVATVGAALDISTAHIHRIFADEEQTFTSWLWTSRLLACRQALREPANAKLSIAEIAFRCGFTHPTHFSRTYRARFGMTASAWRGGNED
jgi:AraC-like DNA-binding protein